MKLSSCVLAAVALLAFAPSALADRFYFGSEEAEEKMSEGSADFIEGVLLKEEAGFYVIRIEGGEIRVPKASVRKIENDGLDEDAIASRESDKADYLAEANALRSQMIAANAAAQRERLRSVRAMEASARRESAVVEATLPLQTTGFDPVLGIAVPAGADTYLIQKELGGIIRRQIQKDLRRQMHR